MGPTSVEETIRSVPPRDPPRVGAIDCASTVTHAFPPAIVIACGLPPTAIVAIALSVLGLMRVTVPSPLLATHTDPAPTATPAGERPTGIVAVTDRVPGSIRTTASSSESTTHTPPAPTAIPVGALPTAIGVGSPLGSTRTTLLASVSVSQIAPSPSAIPAGLAFGSSCLAKCSVRRVEARQQAGGRSDPDRVALRGDRPGPARNDVADPNGGAERVELGIHAADEDTARFQARVQIRLDHPHAIRTGCDTCGRAEDRDCPLRAQRGSGRRARLSGRRGWPPTAILNRTRPRRVGPPPEPPR